MYINNVSDVIYDTASKSHLLSWSDSIATLRTENEICIIIMYIYIPAVYNYVTVTQLLYTIYNLHTNHAFRTLRTNEHSSLKLVHVNCQHTKIRNCHNCVSIYRVYIYIYFEGICISRIKHVYTANIYNCDWNLISHAAKGCYFTKIKSTKTFLKAFPRKFIYPRNIPAIHDNLCIGVQCLNNRSKSSKLCSYIACMLMHA